MWLDPILVPNAPCFVSRQRSLSPQLAGSSLAAPSWDAGPGTVGVLSVGACTALFGRAGAITNDI